MFKTPQLARGASRALRSQRRQLDQPTETRNEFRGLLRRLLREASYLPDTTAQSYFHSHIISRFRAYQAPQDSSCPNEKPVKRSWNATKLLLRRGKVERLRIQAYQTLSLLARANAGHFRDVDQVLNLAYGRAGPLRQRLLQPYLLPDEPKDDTALRSLIEKHSSEKTDNRGSNPAQPPTYVDFPPALVALAKSQIAHRGQLHGPDQIRKVFNTIPAENKWGRPMPLRRVRNAKRRMLVNLTQRVLPPLPKSQWERLKRLAMGEERWEGRARPYPKLRNAEARHLGKRPAEKSPRPLKSRKIDQRFMQRRYRTLFAQTPCIIWHPDSQKWRVEYGTVGSPGVPLTTSSMLQLFGIHRNEEIGKGYPASANVSPTRSTLG